MHHARWVARHARKILAVTAQVLATITGIAVLSTPAQAAATTAAGRTKGTFAVNQFGAATYSIPIWTPPGPKGIQPHIGLSYGSQRSNGYVGVGWSVSGLSSIYRCNLTFAQDAAPAPVTLATGDGYCMDGQRLRLTSTGNYGQPGSTYQTEVANFTNVTAYGTAGNGPAYFIAQDRNGHSYTYGNGGTTSNAQVLAAGTSTAISWMLNEESDPYGNTMTVAYSTTNASSSVVPQKISWTPSSSGSSTYNYTMTFSYGANVPQSSVYKYASGVPVMNANLLNSIAIAYSGTAVKTYYLTYQASPTTARNELEQIQECAGTGTSNCLSPTVMTYQNGSAGVSTSSKTIATNDSKGT